MVRPPLMTGNSSTPSTCGLICTEKLHPEATAGRGACARVDARPYGSLPDVFLPGRRDEIARGAEADGYCMLEAGEDLAGFAFGNFFAEPSPRAQLHKVGKTWHLGKVLFEKWWLAPFGTKRSALGLAIKLGGKAYGIPVVL